jgi:hypothetical protein
MFPVALGAVALVAAVVALAVLVLRAGGGQGPLTTHADGTRFSQPAYIDQTISVSGPLVVENTSDKALVLDRVELVGLPRGMYRGAYVLRWPPKQTPFTAALSYQVPRGAQAVPGATVAPHGWVWIVVGVAPRRGRHQWTQADIVYRSSGTTYRRDVGVAGAVCAPFKAYTSKLSCDIPGT